MATFLNTKKKQIENKMLNISGTGLIKKKKKKKRDKPPPSKKKFPQISNLMRTTYFKDYLYQVHSKTKDWKYNSL